MLHHHHNRGYIDTLQAERRASGTQRRLPEGAGELDAILLAAAGGNRAAWSVLLERFTARVRAMARQHRLGAHDVDDIVQTTWLRLLEHIDDVREPRTVGAWLETTARRESLRALRTAQRQRPTDSEQLVDTPIAPVNEQRLVATEERAAIARALTGLPQRQQRLLQILFADPAPSYHEISLTLGIPIGSIGPTRARILARLRRDPGLASIAGENLG